MLIKIHDEILKKYPMVQIGYLIARVNVNQTDPFVKKLKEGLREHVKSQGIDTTNYVQHPKISLWREIYEKDFGVKPKQYRSSIEALLRRVIQGKPLWNICNIVDLYNYCSLISLLPMGGYDIDKINGDIQLRYANKGEMFRCLGAKEKVPVLSNHIVYADDEQVMCWLWNHKDSAETCIDNESKSVLFFIDGFEYNEVDFALKLLSQNLREIQCSPIESGILNDSGSVVALNIDGRS